MQFILFLYLKKSKNQHSPLYHLIHIIICIISEPTTKDYIILGRCHFLILSVNYRVSFIVDWIIRLSLICDLCHWIFSGKDRLRASIHLISKHLKMLMFDDASKGSLSIREVH